MKFNLLNDILRGLEELEKREGNQQIAPTGMSKMLGNIKITRQPGQTVGKSTPKTYNRYAEQYGGRYNCEYDPNTVAFLGIDKDSDTHHAQLSSLNLINRYDPHLARKILSLD
jgi:hypothetical protein